MPWWDAMFFGWRVVASPTQPAAEASGIVDLIGHQTPTTGLVKFPAILGRHTLESLISSVIIPGTNSVWSLSGRGAVSSLYRSAHSGVAPAYARIPQDCACTQV
jgi:hypothetical protein